MIAPETKARIAEDLIEIESRIAEMEDTIPHEELPAEYDDLIKRRDAGREILGVC